MNLLTAPFRGIAIAREDNRAVAGIHFHRVIEGLRRRHKKCRAERLDHILIGVIVVVQRYDVVKRLVAMLGGFARFRAGFCACLC